jgi:hypothetical protein
MTAIADCHFQKWINIPLFCSFISPDFAPILINCMHEFQL